MSSHDAINHLLARFSSALQIAPPLKLDAAGVCAFAYNNEASIAIEVPDQSSQVYLIGTVMPKPACEGDALAAFYERLLKLNLFSRDIRGASIALEPQSGEVLLCYQHPVSALDETGFYNLLTHFTQTAQALRASFDQASASAEVGHLDSPGSAHFFNQRA